MKIDDFSLRLKNPIRTSSQTLNYRKGFLIYIKLKGVKGVGEATPLPGWTESLRKCKEKLIQIKKNSNLEKRQLRKYPATRHGILLALADAKSRNKGLPLYKYLGKKEKKENILANATIGSYDTKKTVKKSLEKVKSGFECIKLKAGKKSLRQDISRIKSVRKSIPDNIEIRIDVNEGWNRKEAKNAIKELKDTVEYIEQPLDAEDLEGHKNLRGNKIKIALDESLIENSIDKILNSNIGDAVVLKPMVLGGIQKTRKIAIKARDRGVTTIISTSFDGAIARSCAVHIAASIPDVSYCGLATGNIFYQDLIPDPCPVKEGKVKVPNCEGNVPKNLYTKI